MTTPAAEVLLWTDPTVMTVALFLHIAGGSLAILAGYAAVLARKGAPVHRAAGTVFFAAMITMTATAAYMGMVKGQTGNLFAALFAFYLLSTAWLAARRPDGVIGRLEVFFFLWAVAIAVVSLLPNPNDNEAVPAGAKVGFAVVAALAAVVDLKVIVQRGLSGAARISRHLWRMCLAFFIAAGSFFLGQMDVIPDALHGPHLWVLGLAPLAFLVFWLIRVRIGKPRAPAQAMA